MQTLPVRLQPGVDLRTALEELARSRFQAGVFVVCGIGSLLNPRLRLADHSEETALVGGYELLTLSGTLTAQGAHLHMSVASENGQVTGGHVVYGNEVRTTVEALLVHQPAWHLGRALDPSTGFQELVVHKEPGSESDA